MNPKVRQNTFVICYLREWNDAIFNTIIISLMIMRLLPVCLNVNKTALIILIFSFVNFEELQRLCF